MSVEPSKDHLELRILFAANPLASWDAMRPVLDAFLRTADLLRPTQFRPRYDRILELTADAVKRHVGRRDAGVLVLSNERGVGIEWTGYPPRTKPASKLVMRIPFDLLTGSDGADSVLALTKSLCAACPPIYGWGHSEEDVRLANDPHATDAQASQGLVHVYWLTILGAEMVKQLGVARVADTPAYRIESLQNGTVLIVTSPTPADSLSPTAREAQAKALAHLRPDLASGQTLKELHDRSDRLQPASAHWDPSLDAFFRMIVDAVPLAERRAKIQELNAYRPPAITEWRPAADALPSDVNDPAAAIDKYHRDGQTFVAGYHDQLPGLIEADRDALPQVDGYFYLRDVLNKDPDGVRRLMVPTLGAYLGTMIERQLDGQWIPRRNLEESQVVVGDRAWLPFVRVKNLLQSRQAVLDHSLTRYYHEIERHGTRQ